MVINEKYQGIYTCRIPIKRLEIPASTKFYKAFQDYNKNHIVFY